MEWIRENWVFILFFAFFIGMHFFGHGHGGHGRGRGDHEGHGGRASADEDNGHSGEETSEKKDKKGGRGCC